MMEMALRRVRRTRGTEQIVEQHAVKLQVFLCHASEDKEEVRPLYTWLKQNGFSPWLDESNLLPGQDWALEIPLAVRNSQAIIVCLTKMSVSKTGFVQREIKIALDIAEEMPEGSIFILPIKLEECSVPNRLARWQYLDIYSPDGHSRLMKALKSRETQIAEQGSGGNG